MADEAAGEEKIEVDPAFRRKVLLSALAVPLSILAIAWGMAIVQLATGIDVLEYLKPRAGREPTPTWLLVYLALGATPLLAVYSWYCVRKALGLVDHGVEVIGRVASIGKIGQHGMVPLRYSYVYRHHTYTGSVDVLKAVAKEKREAGQVRLIVNSRKPSQSDLYENVFCWSKAQADETA